MFIPEPEARNHTRENAGTDSKFPSPFMSRVIKYKRNVEGGAFPRAVFLVDRRASPTDSSLRVIVLVLPHADREAKRIPCFYFEQASTVTSIHSSCEGSNSHA